MLSKIYIFSYFKCIRAENAAFLIFCQRKNRSGIYDLNEESTSRFSSVCELRNNHTGLFVSPINQNHAHPHSAEFTVTRRRLMFVQQRQAF